MMTTTPYQCTIPRQPTVKYAVVMHTVHRTSKVLIEKDSYEEAEKYIKDYIADSRHFMCRYCQIEKRYYP